MKILSILIPILFCNIIYTQQEKTPIKCENVPEYFTGACKSYFQDGTLGHYYELDSGKVIKLNRYYSDGSLSFEMDQSNASACSYHKKKYYSTGKVKYLIVIENGTGKIEGYRENGIKSFYGAIKDQKLVYPWVAIDRNGYPADTVTTITYNKEINDYNSFLRMVNDGLFSLLFSDVNLQVNSSKTLKELPPAPFELEETPRALTIEESFPQKEAVFPGGVNELKKWITTNLVYPEEAKKNKFEGKVFVEFTINKEGIVSDPNVLRKFPKEIEQEVSRLILAMPKWSPAQENGENISSKVRLPVLFIAP